MTTRLLPALLLGTGTAALALALGPASAALATDVTNPADNPYPITVTVDGQTFHDGQDTLPGYDDYACTTIPGVSYDFANDEIDYPDGQTAPWTEWDRIAGYQVWLKQQQSTPPSSPAAPPSSTPSKPATGTSTGTTTTPTKGSGGTTASKPSRTTSTSTSSKPTTTTSTTTGHTTTRATSGGTGTGSTTGSTQATSSSGGTSAPGGTEAVSAPLPTATPAPGATPDPQTTAAAVGSGTTTDTTASSPEVVADSQPLASTLASAGQPETPINTSTAGIAILAVLAVGGAALLLVQRLRHGLLRRRTTGGTH